MNPEKEPQSDKREQSIEFNQRKDIISQEEYIDGVVKYALSSGWVTERQKEDLIEKYLKPIYDNYSEAIQELKEDKADNEALNKAIIKLNWCLHATRRIGSTDVNNILLEVSDILRRCRETEEEYAVASLYELLFQLLSG